MVENEKSKKGHKISRKVPMSFKSARFLKVLVEELQILKDHLKRAHLQYHTFKLAREDTLSQM